MSGVRSTIELANFGFSLVALSPNSKTPALSGSWKDHSSSDPTVVAGWFKGSTAAAARNIGIRTGTQINGLYLVVIDVDVRDGKPGLKSLEDLQNELGPLPETFTVGTPSDGLHFYFFSPRPIGNSQSRIGAGLDVKGVNGYVVGPGSVIDGRSYVVKQNRPIARLPDAYVEISGSPRRGSGLDRAAPLTEWDQPYYIAEAIEYLRDRAPESGPFNVACWLRARCISEEQCLDLMMEHWPPAAAKGEDHVAVKVANAFRYAQDPPGFACAEVEFEKVEISDTPRPKIEPLDLWAANRYPSNIDLSIVPRYVARFAQDRSKRLGVENGAVVAATITAMSCLIPAKNKLLMRQHSDKWNVRAVIWTGIVGDPGSAKSPAVEDSLVFPRAAERRWRKQFALEADALHLAARPKRKSQPAVDGVHTPEAAETVATLPLKETKVRRKIVNDATTEALCSLLAENEQNAPILYHSDELAGWANGMDAYRARAGKDRPMFLQAKDGGPFSIDRKSSGTLQVKSLAVSILGTIQDDLLAKMARDMADDGLLQRFALVMIRRIGSGVDVPDDRGLDESVERVALALSDIDVGLFRLSPEAALELAAIEQFARDESNGVDLSPALRTWLAKTPNEFGRYCLAFHLIEWATSIEAALDNQPPSLISHQTAVRARRYVQEFLYEQVTYVYTAVMGKGVNAADVKWVGSYLLSRDSEVITAREIARAYTAFKGPENRAKLQAVMAELVAADWLRGGHSGRWTVNPAVHDGRFQDIREMEIARRANVRSAIRDDAAARRDLKLETARG